MRGALLSVILPHALCHRAAPTLGGSVGIIVVSSPARSHPCTDMFWRTLGSTRFVEGLDDAKIVVVLDGYRTPAQLDAERAARLEPRLARDPCALSKKGIVSSDIGASYETFKERLRSEACKYGLGDRIAFDELSSHHGFALCVRRGLEHIGRSGRRTRDPCTPWHPGACS